MKLFGVLVLCASLAVLPACKQDPLRTVAQTLLDVSTANATFESTVESAYTGQIIDQQTASNLMTTAYKIDASVLTVSNMTRNLTSLNAAQRKQILTVINTLLPDIDTGIRQNLAAAGSVKNQQMLAASLDIIRISLAGAQAALQQ